MSVIRAIGRGFAWTTAGTLVGKVISFANIFLILTHLTVYEYGLVELTMSIVSTVGLVLLPGLTSIITTDLTIERAQREYGKMKALFIEFLTLNISFGIIAWAVLFFGSSLVAHLTGNDLIDRFFKVVSFLFLTAPLRAVSTMLATAFVRYADQSFFSVIEEVAKGLWLVFFFFVMEKGAEGLLYASVLAQVVAIMFFAPRTLSAIAEFWGATADDQKPLWTILREHRKWGVASTYIGTLAGNVRLWFIKALIGTEAVGLFAFAYGLYGHLVGLLPLPSVLAPLYPRYLNEKDRLARMVRISAKAQLVLGVALFVIALIGTPIFVRIFFEQFSAAIPTLLVLLVVLIPASVVTVITPVFAAFKEQQSLFTGTIFKLLLTLVFIVPSIFLFGVAGVAVEILLTTLGASIERYFRVKRIIPKISLGPRSFTTLDEAERRVISLFLQRPNMSRLREVLLDFK